MANYNNLLSTINGAIRTNGTGAITGQLLQTILDGMVASLGAKYQYAGVANPSTNPGTPDENVFYLASQAGTYTNFGGLVVNDGEVCALKWDGTWTKDITGAATAEQVSQLGQEVESKLGAFYGYVYINANNNSRKLTISASFFAKYNGETKTFPAQSVDYPTDFSGSYVIVADYDELKLKFVRFATLTARDVIFATIYSDATNIIRFNYCPLRWRVNGQSIVGSDDVIDVRQEIDNSIKSYNSDVFFESTNTAASSIVNRVDVNSLPIGTQIEINVFELIGNEYPLEIRLESDSAYTVCALYTISATGKYYLEKTANLHNLYFVKEGGNDNLYNIVLSRTKEYVIENRLSPNYILSGKESVGLFNPFRGFYANGLIKTESSRWVAWELVRSNGYRIHINSDFSIYEVRLEIWNEDYTSHREISISAETYYGIWGAYAWSIIMRRRDGTALDVDEAVAALSVSYYDGQVFVSPEGFYKKEPKSDSGFGINNKPFRVYHIAANKFLKDGNGNNFIPSQSLMDVRIASRLGFDYIEANIHRTSDNNYICIHGTNNAFGEECKSADESVITTENLQVTLISSVTLAWIRQYVRYDSAYPKYQTTIPTLEEFCQECRNNNIGLLAAMTYEIDCYPIIRKYMMDNVIFVHVPSYFREQTGYDGPIMRWHNDNVAGSVDYYLRKAKEYGKPYAAGIGPNLFASLVSLNRLEDLITAFHSNGFYVCAAYFNEAQFNDARSKGFDYFNSDFQVNPFDYNVAIFDLDSPNNKPSYDGTLTDGVLTLLSGQTMTCENSENMFLGKASLEIRFNGTLQINFGTQGTRTLTSDGTKTYLLSDYLLLRTGVCNITAMVDTDISYFVYKIAKC